MVASVALRNEGPGRNIKARADNYLFFFVKCVFFKCVEHVHSLTHGMFEFERLRVSSRGQIVSLKRKEIS